MRPPTDSRPLPALVLATIFCTLPAAQACKLQPGEVIRPAAGAAPGEATAELWDPGGNFSPLLSLEAANYDSECDVWLTDDESELFFVRMTGENGPPDSLHQGHWDIYRAEWDPLSRTWGTSINLGTHINTEDDDRRPTTTAEGDTLLFSREAHIWYSIRDIGGEFGPADTLFHGTSPCLSSDGLQIYFTRGSDIWVADRGPSGAITDWVGHREVPGPVNSPFNEVKPFISRDGNLLFFSDFGDPRPGGYGDADLWVSTWMGTVWGPPENVGPPVNRDARACTPYLSADGRRIYTASEAAPGTRGEEDLWVAHLDSLPAPLQAANTAERWLRLGDLADAWHVHDLAVDALGTIYAATEPRASLFRSRTGGLSWSRCGPIPGPRAAFSVLPASDGALFLGTYPDGDVFVSFDEGETWSPTADIPGATHVRALLELSDGSILAGVSQGPAVYATLDHGATWLPTGPLQNQETGVKSLFETPAGTVLCGALEGSPNYSTDSGITWNEAFVAGIGGGGVRAEAFLARADGSLLLSGFVHANGARVWVSRDEGRGWVQTTPGEIHFEQISGDSLRAVHGFALAETEAGELLLGTEPGVGGVVLRSADEGATWHREGELAGAFQALSMVTLAHGGILAGTSPKGDVFRWDPTGAGRPIHLDAARAPAAASQILRKQGR